MSNRSSAVDGSNEAVTQFVGTGTYTTFWLSADKVGDYIITITEVTEAA